ncbi:cysteine-rich CWC family protein [Paenibacillus glycanilyticus]|uniref:cysteine-rich CWC family protein n=1 Tax=Paenibacillus glycanilyticus TaxID=126569 RepID=UPI002040E90B|nr:cysteine-rich CWC family protein [Paenibacillus glycanilyticus]MCM3626943.1 cysteine-rich CWC family protein [Paenibacillus glycanilyticus]
MTEETAAHCPICKGDNKCGNLAGIPAGECWCSKETFPRAVFERIPPESLGKACVCQSCLERLKREANEESGGMRA